MTIRERYRSTDKPAEMREGRIRNILPKIPGYPVTTAYHLINLAPMGPSEWPNCRLWARNIGNKAAPILIYKAKYVFPAGDQELISIFWNILGSRLPPNLILFLPKNIPVPESYVQGTSQSQLLMSLDIKNFKRPQITLDRRTTLVRLNRDNSQTVTKLFDNHYPGHAFRAYRLATGLYYGVRVGERLVSVAGVYGYDQISGVAVVGDKVTHPECRVKEFAQLVRAEVIGKLHGMRINTFVAEVARNNQASISSLQKLGFKTHSRYTSVNVQRIG